MSNFKKVIFLICVGCILTACGAVGEAGKVLRNEKSRSTDEFLVKKKEPLSQPPDFRTMPEPGSLNNQEEKSIEKILSLPKEKKDKVKSKNSGVENSILEILR